ncbi:hypothetical protein D9M68_429520 [compost metagenome]
MVGRGSFGCREPSKTAGVQGAALNGRIDPSGIQRRWRPHCKEFDFCSETVGRCMKRDPRPRPKVALKGVDLESESQ